jgi:hypothetical protein
MAPEEAKRHQLESKVLLCNGRFASETAVRQFQKQNVHLDPEVVKNIRWGF